MGHLPIRTCAVCFTWGVMLRLSKLTDYGVVVLVQLAAGAAVQTAPGIARATGLPEPTVAKVLKTLAASGLVVSQRGARGGYRLARGLDQMAVGEVITAIDGPIAMTACVEGGVGGCEAHPCPIRGRWDLVNSAITAALQGITLADMAWPRPVLLGMSADAQVPKGIEYARDC